MGKKDPVHAVAMKDFQNDVMDVQEIESAVGDIYKGQVKPKGGIFLQCHQLILESQVPFLALVEILRVLQILFWRHSSIAWYSFS